MNYSLGNVTLVYCDYQGWDDMKCDVLMTHKGRTILPYVS